MIGARIRQARVQAGLTRSELERAGISHAQLWRIETGASRPSVETLALLAHALNVSADWLLGLSAVPTRGEPSEEMAALVEENDRLRRWQQRVRAVVGQAEGG